MYIQVRKNTSDLKTRYNSLVLIVLFILLVFAFVVDLFTGNAEMSIKDVFHLLSGKEIDTSTRFIFLQIRLTRVITALLTGMALSVAGLLMQTLFRNPLAGPYIMGISSGAGLGVALFLMSFTAVLSHSYFVSFGMVFFAVAGSILVLLILLFVSRYFENNISLLIVGIMIGSMATAIVHILEYYSDPVMVQRFVIWTMGSLSGTDWRFLSVLIPLVILFTGLSFVLIKPMDLYILGEEHALLGGIKVGSLKIMLIIVSSILTAGITAFVGPVSFIGIAVPFLARLVFKSSSYRWLLPGTLVIGGVLMLLCDAISQFPGRSETLPVNAITSLLGAPVVIALLLRNKKTNSTI